MKTFNQGFRESLRGIRDIYAIVSYISTLGVNILTTENNISIDTEDLFDIGTEKGAYNIENDAIYKVRLFNNCTLFKTICNGLELECKYNIPEGTEINVMIGTTNKTSGEVEYIEYGYFTIAGDAVYNADTDTYTMTGYDHMLDAMISFKDNPLEVTYPIKHKELLEAIFDKFNWNYVLDDYANKDFMVDDLYSEKDMTYRDVLDDLLIATGMNMMFDTRKTLRFKPIIAINETITDEDMKDTNVTIGELYGPINKFVSTTDNITYTIGEDTQSIEEFGKTEYDMGQNYLIQSDTSGTMFDNIFAYIDGLSYHTFDIDTTGLLVFDPLDMIKIEHNNIEYPIVLFNDDIKVSKGLIETIHTDIPEENTDTYVTSTPKTQDIKNAIVNVDRLNGTIVLKVDSNNKIAQVELGADADTGTEVAIQADNIDFDAYNFDLDTTNLSITSENVSITNNGIALTGGAVIAGENGLLSLLQSSSGIDALGFGFNQMVEWASTGFEKTIVGCNIVIPEGFKIKEARVTLINSIANYWYWDDSTGQGRNTQGYCRDIKAYIKTGSNITGPSYWNMNGAYFVAQGGVDSGATELTNFGSSSGYTLPSGKRSNNQFDKVTAVIQNPENYFAEGQNYIYVRTNASTSATSYNPKDGYDKTGMGQVVVEVIGWMPYTR